MPLRPALRSLHPRKPQPRQVRRVVCPQCAAAFEVSRRAMSARCPTCTRPLEFKDLILRQRLHGDVVTMGHIELTAPSEMMGRLVCGCLSNQGRFEGRAVVYGAIELGDQSLTTGELTAKSLRVHRGAILRAKADISPRPTAGPTTRQLGSRPLRRMARHPQPAPVPLASVA